MRAPCCNCCDQIALICLLLSVLSRGNVFASSAPRSGVARDAPEVERDGESEWGRDGENERV